MTVAFSSAHSPSPGGVSKAMVQLDSVGVGVRVRVHASNSGPIIAHSSTVEQGANKGHCGSPLLVVP